MVVGLTFPTLNAICFVLSAVLRTLNPPSLVIIASEVRERTPTIVVALLPRAIAVVPTVIVEFCSWLFGILLVPNSPVVLLYVRPDPTATLK